MRFEYTGRHINVTPALKKHVENHFAKVKHLFNGSGTNAHVIIEVERGRHRAEIVVKWHDQTLTATSTVSDMYQALSKTIDKLEKQALRLKNKMIDRKHGAKKSGSVALKTSEVAAAPAAPRIVNMRKFVSKPMTAEEAMVHLSGVKDDFVVFRDADSERVSVIFQRKDGNYGLIQP
jgi:putative sigma-54 modulation protein